MALVLKIDRSPAPIATRHGWADAAVWARLAFTSVMSDLLVVGAVPTGFLLSLNVPSDWLARDVERIIAETSSLCSDAGVAFLGGDTKESSSPNIIGSGVGLVEKNSYLTRAGARPGQSLVLAGTLGGFMAAYLQMVMRKHDDAQAAQWIRYLSHPVARWREAKVVRDARAAVSGMDLSDGLYDGVLSLAGGTLGVELALDRLPCHPFAVEGAQALGVPLINLALCVGDWGLLYAMESSRFNELKAKHAGAELTEVGRFVDEPGVFAVDHGRRFKLRGFVNEHFRSRMEDEQSYIDRVRRHDALTPE